MHLVVRENISVVTWWIAWIVLVIVILALVKIPRKHKLLVILALFVGVKELRFITLSVLNYILTIFLRNKTLLPYYSSYIYKHHFSTKGKPIPPLREPVIFVTNYPIPFHSYFFSTMLPPNTVFVGKNSLFYGVHLISKEYYALGKDGNYEDFKNYVKGIHGEGKNVALFAEEVHKDKDSTRKVGRIKTGIFHIAHELGIKVLPVLIGPVKSVMDIPMSEKRIVHSGELLSVNNVDECIKYTQRFSLRDFSQDSLFQKK